MCKAKHASYDRIGLDKLNDNFNSPKMFWKQLKTLTKTVHCKNSISIETWYEHFSTLFSSNEIHDQEDTDDPLLDQNIEEIEDILFNDSITTEEILKSVNKININKASGGRLLPHTYCLWHSYFTTIYTCVI